MPCYVRSLVRSFQLVLSHPLLKPDAEELQSGEVENIL